MTISKTECLKRWGGTKMKMKFNFCSTMWWGFVVGDAAAGDQLPMVSQLVISRERKPQFISTACVCVCVCGIPSEFLHLTITVVFFFELNTSVGRQVWHISGTHTHTHRVTQNVTDVIAKHTLQGLLRLRFYNPMEHTNHIVDDSDNVSVFLYR